MEEQMHNNKCMYKLLQILCMLNILIKAVSYDSCLAAYKMSNYAWKKLANNYERAMSGSKTSQQRRSWSREKSESKHWFCLLIGSSSPCTLWGTVYKQCF